MMIIYLVYFFNEISVIVINVHYKDKGIVIIIYYFTNVYKLKYLYNNNLYITK
jgi:hypothetical protein